MRLALFLYFLLLGISINAQTVLTLEGQTYANSDETWLGVNIPRDVPTAFTFKNNSISSCNLYGYMLQAGDENAAITNNNLAGEIITGNKFTWSGSDMKCITHGLFSGNNINAVVKYNYLDHVPMGVIRKSSSSMNNTSGGVAYNIIKSGAVGINIKGMCNVNIFNNTLYTDRTPSETWRGLIYVYTNADVSPNSISHGTKIYNNIFYTKYQTFCIQIGDSDCLSGFESDYNVFYCETGSPLFNYCGSVKTFAQWQALGYDVHSKVINPYFKDFVNFVPAARLDYGTDLGSEWANGLSLNARWGTTDPETAMQSGKWQVGAIVYATTPINSPPVVSISSPAKSSAYISPATFTIDAVASDPDGSIYMVEFFSGSTKLGERTAAPYSFTWKEVPEGTYSLTAIATDNSNGKTISDPVTVIVEKTSPAINQLPVVNIKSPENESTFEAPATIMLTADASDADGAVSKVEYYCGDLKIGESFTSPWQVSFECTKTGTYDINAVATDNLNALTSSPAVKISVSFKNEYPDIINLYPNPNTGRFSINLLSPLPDEENAVIITNLSGQTVYYGALEKKEHTMQLDLSYTTAGKYILMITSGKRIITTRKFIKN
jgi:hypothetical protein